MGYDCFAVFFCGLCVAGFDGEINIIEMVDTVF